MAIWRVKLTYNSPTATGYDDESIITVNGTLEELQQTCIKFYRSMGVFQHDRYGSDQITENGRPCNLAVDVDCSIIKYMEHSMVLPGEKPISIEDIPSSLKMGG